MTRYYYDFHSHSCLSPCADNDNTPNNLAGMAALNGVGIMALTDHNTCRNCPAFFAACKRYGVVPVAGMELTTAEDIHVVCLFEHLEEAMAFDREIDGRRTKIPNRTDIFGDQLILDEEDEVMESDPYYLPVATNVTLDECPSLVSRFGGVCYPAHIDRVSNGAIAILGAFPHYLHFNLAEFHDRSNVAAYTEKYDLSSLKILVSSDAHYLSDLREENDFLELDDEPYSSALVRQRLFEYLRST